MDAEDIVAWMLASEVDTEEYSEQCPPPNTCFAKGKGGSLAYESFVDDKVAEAYTKLSPKLPAEDFHRLLAHAALANLDDTVKLIFQIGNVRKNGGGQRNAYHFLLGYLWLLQHFPTTALENLHRIPQHTCLKHLLDIVMFAIDGTVNHHPLFSALQEMEAQRQTSAARMASLQHSEGRQARNKRRRIAANQQRAKFAGTLGKPLADLLEQQPVDMVTDADTAAANSKKSNSSKKRKFTMLRWRNDEIAQQYQDFAKEEDARKAAGTDTQRATHVETRLAKNGTSQFVRLLRRQRYSVMKTDVVPSWMATLYNTVIDIFVAGFLREMKEYQSVKGNKKTAVFTSHHGLYAKFFPTFGGLHDKATDLANAIARDLYAELFKMRNATEVRNQELDAGSKLLHAFKGGGSMKVHQLLSYPNTPIKVEHVNSMGRRGHRNRQLVVTRIYNALRKAAGVSEVHMHAGTFDKINYDRVTSGCMQRASKLFEKQDSKRFRQWLCDARQAAVRELQTENKDAAEDDAADAAPKPSIKTTTLLPNTVVWRAVQAYAQLETLRANESTQEGTADDDQADAAGDMLAQLKVDAEEKKKHTMQQEKAQQELDTCNLQWHDIVKRIVKSLEQDSIVNRWVPMVDTSGSMEEQAFPGQPHEERPMAVGLALALLLAEINEGRGRDLEGKIIAFHTIPKFVQVWDPRLSDAPRELRNIGKVAYDLLYNGDCMGGSTNFVLALKLATDVRADAVVCFTDMAFDEASGNETSDTQWNSVVESMSVAMGKEFPQLVLWNLSQREIGQPVDTANFSGVIQLAGWSPAVLQFFLKGDFKYFTTNFFLQQLFKEKFNDVRAADIDKEKLRANDNDVSFYLRELQT